MVPGLYCINSGLGPIWSSTAIAPSLNYNVKATPLGVSLVATPSTANKDSLWTMVLASHMLRLTDDRCKASKSIENVVSGLARSSPGNLCLGIKHPISIVMSTDASESMPSLASCGLKRSVFHIRKIYFHTFLSMGM